MDIGMIGLGRMGANMAERLVRAGHRVVGYDVSTAAVRAAERSGVEAASTLPELIHKLAAPRAVWLMVPAGHIVDQTLAQLQPYLGEDDVILDGGNSNYKATLRRAASLKDAGLHFIDVGTSGGIWGLSEGYCLMVGGEATIVRRLKPVFEALAPAPDQGWGHVGASGAGHYAKMIHNGVEYGMMQAYAEGFAIIGEKKDLGLDVGQISEIWRHGSVVRSWLLDLVAVALKEDPGLEEIAPYVQDSGEGRWAVAEAIDLEVSAPVITLSLLQRLRSRTEESFADKLVAAMRQQFGGHPTRRPT